ncbi:MAG: hypothetical protein JWN56_485 [Sphingobacteriales bacterium]|nr:hypothetical protein [Sphingobacteriales bacterium]
MFIKYLLKHCLSHLRLDWHHLLSYFQSLDQITKKHSMRQRFSQQQTLGITPISDIQSSYPNKQQT